MNYTDHWYQIKGWHADDEWVKDDSVFDNPITIAEWAAEEHWNRDPHDPSQVDLEVWVKSQDGIVKKYNVQAEAAVNFYANEVE